MINLISYKNLLHLSIVLLQLVVGSPSKKAPRLPLPQWHLYFCRSTRIQYWSSNLHYHQKYIGHNWPISSIMLHPRPKGIITMVASVSLVIVLLRSSMNNVVLCTYDYAELLYVITSIVGGTHDHDSHEWRDKSRIIDHVFNILLFTLSRTSCSKAILNPDGYVLLYQ